MVTLTMKEELKLEVIQRVMDNQIDISKAAQILGLRGRSVYFPFSSCFTNSGLVISFPVLVSLNLIFPPVLFFFVTTTLGFDFGMMFLLFSRLTALL